MAAMTSLGCAGFEARVQSRVGERRGHRRGTALPPSACGCQRAQVGGCGAAWAKSDAGDLAFTSYDPSPLPFLYQTKLWQNIRCTLDFGVHLVFCHTFCVACYASATPASVHFVFRLKTMGVHHRSCGRANGFAPNLSVHFVLRSKE